MVEAQKDRMADTIMMHDAEIARLQDERDSAWDDAVEAALSELHWLCADDKAAIRALRKP